MDVASEFLDQSYRIDTEADVRQVFTHRADSVRATHEMRDSKSKELIYNMFF